MTVIGRSLAAGLALAGCMPTIISEQPVVVVRGTGISLGKGPWGDYGFGEAVGVADLDLDGTNDLMVASNVGLLVWTRPPISGGEEPAHIMSDSEQRAYFTKGFSVASLKGLSAPAAVVGGPASALVFHVGEPEAVGAWIVADEPSLISISTATLSGADDGADAVLLARPDPSPSAFYVVRGVPTGDVHLTTPTFTADVDTTVVGYTATSADVDGDGVTDLIAAAPYWQPNHGIGAVLVFHGPLDRGPAHRDPDMALIGRAVGDQMGWGVSARADADGDGLPDLWSVVLGDKEHQEGEPHADARVVVVPGTLRGRVTETEAIGRILHDVPDDSFGWNIASGDLDGDGLGDVAVAEPWRGEDRRGRVYVTLSPIEGISTTRHGLIVGGVGVDDTLGHGDVGMGDLDGDGIDDLLIGSDWAADYDGRVWWYPSGG
jgi:hypothetical protein